MNIAIYNKDKIALEPIVTIGYIIGSRAKRKGPAGKAGPQTVDKMVSGAIP